MEKLNAEINACLEDPGLKARFADLGGTVLAGSSSEFAGLMGDEIPKWAKVVKFAGIRASDGRSEATAVRWGRREQCAVIGSCTPHPAPPDQVGGGARPPPMGEVYVHRLPLC